MRQRIKEVFARLSMNIFNCRAVRSQVGFATMPSKGASGWKEGHTFLIKMHSGWWSVVGWIE